MTKKAKRLLLLLLLISLVFAYGTFFYPHGANEFSGGSLEPPSLQHICGTDDLGIDIFAQLSRGYWDSWAKISMPRSSVPKIWWSLGGSSEPPENSLGPWG